MEFFQIVVSRLTRNKRSEEPENKESRECQRFPMNPKYTYAAASTARPMLP